MIRSYNVTIPVTSTGFRVRLGDGSPGDPLPIPATRGRVMNYTLSALPSSTEQWYAATNHGGPLSTTELAAAYARGDAVIMDPGEQQASPDNVPGPFIVDVAVAPVDSSATVNLRLTVDMEEC